LLDEPDHWIKEVRRAPGYVRYMDDLVVWSENKAWLWALADDLAEHVASTWGPELTAEQLTACARSMDGSRQFLHAGEGLRSEIEL
jgi:hypothetical protein